MLSVLFPLVQRCEGRYVCWELLAQKEGGLWLSACPWQRQRGTLQSVTWPTSYRDEFCWLRLSLILENGRGRNILRKGKAAGKVEQAAEIQSTAVTRQVGVVCKPWASLHQAWVKTGLITGNLAGLANSADDWVLSGLIFIGGRRKGFPR